MPHPISRRRIRTTAAVVLSIGMGPFGGATQPGGNPFEFLAPSVIVSPEDRARLDRDQVHTRTLPCDDGQLAIFVVTRVNAQPDALVAWTRAIAELKRSKFVMAVGRFSDPPSPSDLEQLTLDDRDLDAIRRCRPGACGVKLSAGEIESLTAVVARAGPRWQDPVQARISAAARQARHPVSRRRPFLAVFT